MTSQARIDANRQNAKNSTGPRTAAGKETTRLNGLKHGLRSEEVVLPTEDRSAFDSHLAAWMDDWKPPTETRRFLVERAATAAWRIKRCVRAETNRLAARARKGSAEWDAARDAAVVKAVEEISDRPEAAVNELMANKSGVHALWALWGDLDDALNDPKGWCDMELHHNRLCHLLGINGHDDPEHLRQTSEASYRLLLRVRTDLADEDLTPLDDAMAAMVRKMLLEICEAKGEEFLSRCETLPDESKLRNRYAELKAFAPQPEDATYHRYEGRLDREARAAIAQLIKLEQTGADLMAMDEEPEAPSEPIKADPSPASEPDPPTEPNAVPPQGLVTQADRDRGGRIWTPEANDDRPQAIGMPWLNQ